MRKQQNIDQQVDETLNSLDSMQKASPGHFFFTRVQARLNRTKKDIWEHALSFISKPAFLAAAVIVIIMIDVMALANLKPAETNPAAEQAQVFAEEYNFTIATIYDYSKPENR